MSQCVTRIFILGIVFASIGCEGESTRFSKSTNGTTEVQLSQPRSEQVVAPSQPQAAVEPLTATTVQGVALQPKSAINGKLSLLIPEEFTVMSEEMLSLKYPSSRRPTLVYTNEAGSVNVAINHTQDRMPPASIAAFHRQMDGTFRSLYPSAQWFDSRMTQINGRSWMLLHFRTPAIDTEVRNLMVGTSLDGRLLIVSANITRELEDQWLAPAEAIIQSVRINE